MELTAVQAVTAQQGIRSAPGEAPQAKLHDPHQIGGSVSGISGQYLAQGDERYECNRDGPDEDSGSIDVIHRFFNVRRYRASLHESERYGRGRHYPKPRQFGGISMST
jgi:hypothetical protein